jgi:CubicO group peptidase (beta-lactamase class C family)
MKTRGVVLLVLLAVLAGGEQTYGCPEGPPTAPLPPGTLDEVFASIDKIAMLAYKHNIAVGVVYDQQLVHFVGSPGVSADSAFRIGSNSKVLTSLVAWLGHQSGALHLDDPVSQAFPVFEKFRNRWTEGKRSITWRDLLSHRAGLARESPCQALWGECNRTLEQVTSIVKDWPAIGPLASRPSYSNLGFALSGHMLAQVRRKCICSLLSFS